MKQGEVPPRASRAAAIMPLGLVRELLPGSGGGWPQRIGFAPGTLRNLQDYVSSEARATQGVYHTSTPRANHVFNWKPKGKKS